MPGPSHKIRVSFSVTNCICYDQRVHKIAEVVTDMNCSVTVIGRKTDDCNHTNSFRFKTKRFKMIFRKGFLFYKFYNIRLLFFLLFQKVDLLVANDLDTLFPNYIVSKLKQIPLIYDSHEYFTGVPEIQNRPFVKWVWTTIEKLIFPRLKYVMTVSDSIAEKYESEYGIRPLTIRNLSRRAGNIEGYTRSELSIPEDNLLLIFQGGGINIDRGGEELIEAINMTDKAYLLIIGSGDVLQKLKSRVSEFRLDERIRFISRLSWTEMMRYTRSSDAGLSLDKNSNTNYRFSLPNKLFDYISSGIPVIAGDLPEVKKIIEGYNCGIVIPVITPEEISIAIKKLADNRNLLNKLKQNTVNASEMLNWEMESIIVRNFYKKVFSAALNNIKE